MKIYRSRCFLGESLPIQCCRVQDLGGRADSESSRMACFRLVQEGVKPVVIMLFMI